MDHFISQFITKGLSPQVINPESSKGEEHEHTWSSFTRHWNRSFRDFVGSRALVGSEERQISSTRGGGSHLPIARISPSFSRSNPDNCLTIEIKFLPSGKTLTALSVNQKWLTATYQRIHICILNSAGMHKKGIDLERRYEWSRAMLLSLRLKPSPFVTSCIN